MGQGTLTELLEAAIMNLASRPELASSEEQDPSIMRASHFVLQSCTAPAVILALGFRSNFATVRSVKVARGRRKV